MSASFHPINFDEAHLCHALQNCAVGTSRNASEEPQLSFDEEGEEDRGESIDVKQE